MRFVILDHHPPETKRLSAARTSHRHFDLMFEVCKNDRLETYAVTELPQQGKDTEITRLADHRAMYLNYEGPISDNRGAVERFAHGEWDGDLHGQAILSFNEHSKNFASEAWTIGIDATKLLRIS